MGKRILKAVITFLLIVLVAGAAVFGVFAYKGYEKYKSIVEKDPLEDKVASLRNKNSYVKYEDIAVDYFNAVVAVEDERYWKHGAIDIKGLCRAVFINLVDDDRTEGGSTITMQVAKNFYFVGNDQIPARDRKVIEIFMAFELQKKYTKKEILEMYANLIYFGSGYTGISNASEGYFQKTPSELTLAESIMLAGVPNAPSAYSPRNSKDLCKSRMGKVIDSMVSNKYITREEAGRIDMSFVDRIYAEYNEGEA